MTKDSVKNLTKKIRELPPLNVVVQKLLDIVGDENSSAEEVARTLSCDQAIAGKVLELVNSSFYGYTRRISTITRAAVILGNKGVQNLAIAFSTINSFEKYETELPKEIFWRHSLSVAAAAQLVAQQVKYPEPEEAFVAGLLHDIGALTLSCFCPAEFKEVVQNPGENVCVTENKLIGISHAQVAEQLFEHWRLPEVLCMAAKHHHDGDKIRSDNTSLLAILYVAELMAKIKGDIFFETLDDDVVFDVCEKLNFSPARLADLLRLLERQNNVIANILLPALDGDAKNAAKERLAGCFVIVGFKHQRIEWLRSIIGYLGGEPRIVLASKINEIAALEAKGCVLDAEKLPRDAVMEVLRALRTEQVPVAFYGEIPDFVANSSDLTIAPEQRLSLTFRKEDLEKALKLIN